jgi:hypothetical protein
MDDRAALLNNALDSLDRLFDRESSVIDVYAIVYATSRALRTDPLTPVFMQAAAGLLEVVQTGESGAVDRDRALNSTQTLRAALAEALPFPEEPKQ